MPYNIFPKILSKLLLSILVLSNEAFFFYTFLLFSNLFPYFSLIKYCSYQLLLIRNFRSVHFHAHSPQIVHFNRSLCSGNLKQHKLHILEDLFFQAHIFTFLRTHMIKLIYQCYRRDYSFILTDRYSWEI
jgi:hypothetical protein